MHTALVVGLVWVGVSVLVGVGFSLGAAIGYRRGLEAGLEAGTEERQPAHRRHAHEPQLTKPVTPVATSSTPARGAAVRGGRR